MFASEEEIVIASNDCNIVLVLASQVKFSDSDKYQILQSDPSLIVVSLDLGKASEKKYGIIWEFQPFFTDFFW